MLVPSHNPRYYFHVPDKDPKLKDDPRQLNEMQVIREIWCENVYEVYDGDFSDTKVCVDLGANIGVFTAYAVELGAEKVIAVEPEPNNIELLTENLLQNKIGTDKVVIEDRGVSDLQHGKTAIISNEGGGSTIKDPTKNGTEIELVTLDQLWKDHDLEFVDVMKIDVEGSEADIILGASKDTLSYVRYIVIELDHIIGNDFGRVVQKLSETHQVKTVGSWKTGGMLFARRY